MPRLLDSTRQLRRDQIADAALTLFARDGFAQTSMADVVAESGMSAGSIYSHFSGKNELMRYAAARTLAGHTADLNSALTASASGVLSPAEILTRILGDHWMDRTHAQLLMQIWAEAPRDAELANGIAEHLTEVEAMFAGAALPWALTVAADRREAQVLAARCGTALLAAAQGIVGRLALDPGVDKASLVEAVAAQLPR